MMKNNRVFNFCLLFILFYGIFSVTQIKAENLRQRRGFYDVFENPFSGQHLTEVTSSPVKTPFDGGIRELVPIKHLQRYQNWKNEFLSTEFGREQWNRYASNKNFVLIIKISDEVGRGGGTRDYQWDEKGNLVGATIILGSNINKGFPSPVYYPVLNSLSITHSIDKVNENILAAVKIAHEFGHVIQTAKINGEIFRQQDRLMTEYNKIFNSNKFNTREPRLVSLEKQLGGTPLDIWANREYWGEENAMFYLLSRIEKEKTYCPIVDKIEINIKTYAASYENRFLPVFKSSEGCRN